MSISSDVRHGVRSLRRTFGPAALSFATLSLVLGVTTCVFAVLNAVVLQPFPYGDVQQLAVVWGAPSFDVRPGIDGQALEAWQVKTRMAKGTSVFQLTPTHAVIDHGGDEPSDAYLVGTNMFAVLGSEPMIGRAFSTADETNPAVTIISYALWQQQFGGDPSTLGRVIDINDRPHVIVGVMPKGFFFPDTSSQLWLPLTKDSAAFRQVQGIVRLKSPSDLQQVNAQLSVSLRPESHAATWRGAGLFPLQRLVMLEYDSATWILFAATMLLVLAACGNVAIVLLADRLDRRDDLLIRQSLGASRRQLMFLLLVEPAILSSAAAAVGLGLADVMIHGLGSLHLSMVPRLEFATLDTWTLGFAFGLTIVCTFLCGLAPALSYESNIAPLLSGALTVVGRRSRAKELVIVVQVGATCTLLFGALLLTTSFVTRIRSDWGFRPEGLLLADVSLPQAEAKAPLARSAGITDALTQARRSFGSDNVAMASGVPIKWSQWSIFVPLRDGMPLLASTASQWAVSDHYFDVMGIPVIEGRDFTEEDLHLRRVIINRRLANALWNHTSAIGKYVGRGKQDGGQPALTRSELGWVRDGDLWQVIGVAADVRMFGLDSTPPPTVYVQYADDRAANMGRVFFVARLNQHSGAAGSLRDDIVKAEPSWHVNAVYSMSDLVAQSVGGRGLPKLLSLVSTCVALLSALVMALGVFAVISLNVKAMTRNVAVRRALGCSTAHIVAIVLRSVWTALASGTGIGLLISFAAASLLRPFLFGVSSTDWRVFGIVAFGIAVVGALGTLYPVSRALRVSPAVALRQS